MAESVRRASVYFRFFLRPLLLGEAAPSARSPLLGAPPPGRPEHAAPTRSSSFSPTQFRPRRSSSSLRRESVPAVGWPRQCVTFLSLSALPPRVVCQPFRRRGADWPSLTSLPGRTSPFFSRTEFDPFDLDGSFKRRQSRAEKHPTDRAGAISTIFLSSLCNPTRVVVSFFPERSRPSLCLFG